MADALLPGFILEQFLWLSCKYWEWDEERGIHDGSAQWAIAVLCCHCCLHTSKL